MLKPKSKLETLADVEGFETTDDLLASAVADSVCPGICTSPTCSYTCQTEPDQDAGWCELCGTGTVMSALILAGLI